jgi:hypothetical protein
VRNFVVAAWERRRHRERELSVVEADTAEHAIAEIAAALPAEQQPGIYEAWPVEDPAHMVRVTYGRRPKTRPA